MLPTKNDVHTDKVLTNVLTAYRNPSWIWDQFAPIIDTGGRESDKYYTFPKADWLRQDADIVAPGAPAPISGFRISSDTFSCEEYAISAELPDRVLNNADDVLKQNLRQSQAIWCADQVNSKIEKKLADTVFTSDVWGTTNTTATDWDDYDSSTPIDDIETAKWTIMSNTGMDANTIVLGAEVWKDLKRNPEVLDLLGAHERGTMTPETLAALLDVNRILVGKASYTATKEGQSSITISKVWGQNALVAYVPSAPGIMTPAAAYTFQAQSIQGRRWREDNASHRKTEFVEASIILGFKLVGSDLGYYFSGIVS